MYAGDFAYFIEPAPSDSEGGEGREEIIIDLLFRAKACRFPLLSVPSSAHNMLKVDVSKGGDEKCEVEEEEKGEEGEKLKKKYFLKTPNYGKLFFRPNLGGSVASWQRWCVRWGIQNIHLR